MTDPFDRHKFIKTGFAQFGDYEMARRDDLLRMIANAITQSEIDGADVAIAELRRKAEAWTAEHYENARAELVRRGVDPDARGNSLEEMLDWGE